MRLARTYEESKIHQIWQRSYRTPSMLALDAQIYDWIAARVDAAGSWLDAGCGYGERTVFLARRSTDVTAVDVAPSALRNAGETIAAAGLSHRVRFATASLEDAPAGRTYSNVHCRGVLMHIPDWQRALKNLCASVECGGHLIVFENNMRSLETAFVMLLRRFRAGKSRITSTRGGLEFWSEQDGLPFIVRVADLQELRREMEANGVAWLTCRPTAFVDPHRVPRALRPLSDAFSRLWFRLRLPFGSGVAIIGRKT